MKELSERAGVALQTFYRHFGTKDELLLAVMEENINRGARAMLSLAEALSDPVERLHMLTTMPIRSEYEEEDRRVLAWSARERQRLSGRFPAAVVEVHQAYRNTLRDAIESIVEGGLGYSVDPDLDATILQHEVMTVTHLIHGGGLDQDPEVVAERVWTLFWKGLCGAGSDSSS